SDLRGMVYTSRLKIAFSAPERELSEREFFDFVGNNNFQAAIGSIRRLLETFAKASFTDDIWSDDQTCAMGFPALALARLDARAFTILDNYFRRRDTDHEHFGSDEILPALARGTNSFASLEAQRFALARLADEELMGQGRGAKLAPSILAGARALGDP